MRTALLRNAAGLVLIAAAVLFVAWFYFWTVRTSGGFNPPGDEDYYNFQVRGWRQGHLHMSKEPGPALLALADPYDPEQNRDVRLADASYFKGHYYLYFGAAPAALLMLPYDVVTGRELGTTTAIYVYCLAGFLAASGLWLLVRRRYFPSSSAWVGACGVLVLGLGTHVLALERRPLVWELPISMGYAFSMFALLGIYAALHGKRPAWAMGAAGLCLGLAVAARPTCLLGALMFIPPLWHMGRRPETRRVALRCAFAAAVGLGACLAAVLAHNFARFGNLLEFGQNYQLSGVYESRARHFSLSYLPHNIFLYYFHPGSWSWTFPFVSVSPVSNGPPGYLGNWSEAICGLAVTFPVLWLAFALPFAGTLSGGGRESLRALIASVAGLYGAMSLAILAYFVATERYMADFTPSLGLLALFGLLGLEGYGKERGWNRWVAPIGALACLITAVAGILVSFDYHGGALRTLSPAEWDAMRRFFSRFGL
jgi:hypothetical protein